MMFLQKLKTFGWVLINQFHQCIKILMKIFTPQSQAKSILLCFHRWMSCIWKNKISKKPNGHLINKKDHLTVKKLKMKRQCGLLAMWISKKTFKTRKFFLGCQKLINIMLHFKKETLFIYLLYGTIKFLKCLVKILTLWRSIIGLIWNTVRIIRFMRSVESLKDCDNLFLYCETKFLILWLKRL